MIWSGLALIKHTSHRNFFFYCFICTAQKKLLQFQQPFDENGLFYYIGTKGGTREFLNPHETGDVQVTFSSSATDLSYSQVHKLVGRSNEGYCCTDNRPRSWMSVDIGAGRKLFITHYALKNDGLGTYHCLRNWELQGRLAESDEWVVLSSHTDDSSLTKAAFATAAWPVTSEVKLSGFRFFRILQTGLNSYGAHNIMCGGLELYGELYQSSSSLNNSIIVQATTNTSRVETPVKYLEILGE